MEKYILMPVLALMFVALLLNYFHKPKEKRRRTVTKQQPLFTVKSIEFNKKMQKENLLVLVVLGAGVLVYHWLFGV